MGVMPCCRNGCSNVMSDFYDKEIGYICELCIREFYDIYEGTYMPKQQYTSKLKKFMKTEKGEIDHRSGTISIDEFCESLSVRRDPVVN